MVDHYFFFNDTATTEIYTLSLHDALPISDVLDRDAGPAIRTDRGRLLLGREPAQPGTARHRGPRRRRGRLPRFPDRKSTRLNSSHANISYAVFCLKKKTSNLVFRRIMRSW